MKWTKFRVKTVTEAEDIVISTLYDIGLEGAQIEDKIPLTALEKEQMFVDILPEGPEDCVSELFCGGKRGREPGNPGGEDGRADDFGASEAGAGRIAAVL